VWVGTEDAVVVVAAGGVGGAVRCSTLAPADGRR
jgi:hypothetical protein